MAEDRQYIPDCEVFLAGAYPYKDPRRAVRQVLKDPVILPHWPQLPKKSVKEKTFTQTLAAVQTPDGAFPRGTASAWLGAIKAAGAGRSDFFKTQLAGPISLFGRLPESHDPHSQERLLHYVTMWMKHAYWQIEQLRERGFLPIIVLDEPMLPTHMGPPGTSRYRRGMKLLHSIILRLKRKKAIVGIHCCNRISPKVLIETGADLVHFDAYHFPTMVEAARVALQDYMRDGGLVAWGIIPVSDAWDSTIEAKVDKKLSALLEDLESSASGKGLTLKKILAQSLIATTCGMGLNTPVQSDKIVDFAIDLSKMLKKRYF